MTTISTNLDTLQITAQADAIGHDIAQQQAIYAKARSRKALAGMVVGTFRVSLSHMRSTSIEAQNLVFSRHQVNMGADANRFSPYIASSWGEVDPKGKAANDLDGNPHPKWVSDKAMARYFHTMESLVEAGFDENSSFEEMVQWIMDQGGAQTVANKRQKSLSEKAEPNEESVPQFDAILDEAFASQSAVQLPSKVELPKLLPGQTMICIVRNDGKDTSYLPLPNADTSVIAEMSAYRSTGMDNASTAALFWHQVATVAPAIIPDLAKSEEPVEPLAPTDKANASTPMKAANAIYMLDGSTLSVANGRMDDTRILTIEPHDDVDTEANSRVVRFLDKRTRNTMFPRFAKPSVCAGFGKEGAIKSSKVNDRLRLSFKHKQSGMNGQLLFPEISLLGSNWTQ